jgi:hypothetical protein
VTSQSWKLYSRVRVIKYILLIIFSISILIHQYLGANPRILFDRKEVILPVVPLNVQSRCSFRIINNGYENLTLNYSIIQEFGNVGLELDFPEGKNLGITKNKIRVEARFHYKRPISFSIPVEFFDENQRTYSIIISGTTDNCIFTNYQFIQRMSNTQECSFQLDDKYQIQYLENDVNSVDYEINDNNNNMKPKTNANYSLISGTNNNANLLGYQPIS